MSSRWYMLVVDANDPARLARWWAEVLDYRLLDEAPGEVTIGRDEDCHPSLVFVSEPDPKTARNRLHVELAPEDQAAEVERLVDMGARRVDVGRSREAKWVALADPEGNEFCVLPAPAR